MTPEDWKEVRRIADKLIESCDGGADLTDDIYALSQEQMHLLDTMALECHTCGQWYDAAGMILAENGCEYECSDCHG